MPSNYLPPLEPIGDFRSYVCGDVVINETAAIASGVLLQADQGGKIIIAAGVCIGMGAVLHAQDGLLEIGAGANLGAGVLVYGSSKIGEGACIGASSSIVRAVIAKGAIVPPCSLISGLEQGAIEKEISPAIAQDLETKNVITHSVECTITETQLEIPNEAVSEPTLESMETHTESNDLVNEIGLAADTSSLVSSNSAQAKAYAQSQINRYIKRLFPNN
jgi:carbon dioxide concentrating mechanism protein CcmN